MWPINELNLDGSRLSGFSPFVARENPLSLQDVCSFTTSPPNPAQVPKAASRVVDRTCDVFLRFGDLMDIDLMS